MVNVLVLEAWQDPDKVNACRYALLKYLEVYNLQPPAGIAVYVYTDQPALFESFLPFFHQFEIKEVSQTQLREWQGTAGFPQRIKLEILSEVLHHLDANVLFLDFNTYIHSPLEELFSQIEKGTLVLHSRLGSLEDPADAELGKLRKFLSTGNILHNQQHLSTRGVQIWDSHLIGINSRSKALIDDALELVDVVYKQYRKGIIEPFAVSYCFQNGKVEAGSRFGHYYGNLPEFRQLLHAFFKKNEEESIPNLVKQLHGLDAATIEKQKLSYRTLPFYKRWIQVLKGRSWNIKQYEKKI